MRQTRSFQSIAKVAKGWTTQVVKDWQWLRANGDSALPPADDFSAVHMYLAVVPLSLWKSTIKKARLKSVLLQRILADRLTFNRFQTKQFVTLGLEVASAVSEQQDWPCAHCHRAFSTYQGLRSHARQAHGELHVSNQYAKFENGFWSCASCLEAFATKNNLVRHLKSHKKCLDLLVAVCPYGFGSDPESLKGIKLHDGNMKDAVQLVGPLIGRPIRSWFAEGFSQGDIPEGMVRPVRRVLQADVARDA